MKKRDLELIQIALHHVVNECRKVQNITASDIGALACQELVREYDRISQLITKGNWTFWLGYAEPDLDRKIYEIRPLYAGKPE